jgi:hypothetical protein
MKNYRIVKQTYGDGKVYYTGQRRTGFIFWEHVWTSREIEETRNRIEDDKKYILSETLLKKEIVEYL